MGAGGGAERPGEKLGACNGGASALEAVASRALRLTHRKRVRKSLEMGSAEGRRITSRRTAGVNRAANARRPRRRTEQIGRAQQLASKKK